MPTWDKDEDEDRREFLKTCGRFVAVTPPAMTLLLSTSLTSRAIARSGGRDGRGNDDNRGRSFFDNDRPVAGASGTSGSSSQGGGASQSQGGAASGDGGASGGGAARGGAASFTNIPGNKSALGASGCADDEDAKRKWRGRRRRNLDCDPPELKASNLDRSERIGMRQSPGGH
jgi:hypothetical protein